MAFQIERRKRPTPLIWQSQNTHGQGDGVIIGNPIDANQDHTRAGAEFFEDQSAEILVFRKHHTPAGMTCGQDIDVGRARRKRGS